MKPIMEKCIVCDKPLPPRSAKSKKAKDLVCAACNKGIDDQLEDTKPKKKAKLKADKEVAEIRERLKSLEKLSNELKEMIESNPDYCGESEEMLEALPKALQPFAFTPVKSYKMIQFLLALTKGEYMDTIIKEDSEVRLQKALKTSIEEEDYRKSAKIRDKLKEKTEKKPKTK